MRVIMSIIVFSFCFTIPPTMPRADESPVRFALMEFYPFGRTTESGKIDGIYWDIIQDIQKLSGVKMNTLMMPIPRLRRSISGGISDLAIAGASSSLINGASSLGVVGCSRIIIQTSKTAGIQDLEGLANKPIAFVTNGFLHKAYGNKFGLNAIQTSSGQSMFAMLDRGRVDGIFISDVVADSFILTGLSNSNISSNWRESLGPRVLVKTIPSHLQISNKFANATIRQSLKNAIILGNKTGVFEKTYPKYGVQTKGKC
jgi:ABC-type amino acid transport substrate-binding protein